MSNVDSMQCRLSKIGQEWDKDTSKKAIVHHEAYSHTVHALTIILNSVLIETALELLFLYVSHYTIHLHGTRQTSMEPNNRYMIYHMQGYSSTTAYLYHVTSHAEMSHESTLGPVKINFYLSWYVALEILPAAA